MVPPLISRHLFPPAISKIALKSCSHSTGKKMQEKQEINYFFHDNDANKQVSHSFLLQIDFVFNIRVDESASPILAGLRVNLTMPCSRPGMVIAVMVGVAACRVGSAPVGSARASFSIRGLPAGVASSNACHSVAVLPSAESTIVCSTLNWRHKSGRDKAGLASNAFRMARRVSMPSRVKGRGITSIIIFIRINN